MAKGNKTATLGAGSIFEVSYDNGINFEQVKGMTAVGAIGTMAEALETTAVDERARTYIGGLENPESKAFTGNYRPELASQQRFYQAARDKETVVIRITLPTSPLSINTFESALLGHQVNEPTPDGAITFTNNGQQSGRVTVAYAEKVPVSSVTITATKSIALSAKGEKASATVSPATATYKGIRYLSQDSSVCAIDPDSGEYFPKKVGSTRIIAISEDGDYQATQTLTVTA